MLKRLITAAVGVVGLVVVGLGVASATVWRADDVLVATATGDAAVVLTEPGVLELGGDPATVTVTAPGDAPLVLAVGRDTDVLGWVGDDAHTTVTGLSDWHALAVEEVAAVVPEPAATEDAATEDPAATDPAAQTPAPDAAADAAAGAADDAEQPATVADPTGSDLWVAEATGNGSVELEWPAQEGRWSLLAVSTSGSAPTLQLAWPRTVTTPWLWPCVVVGGLLVLGALVVALRGLRRRRAPEPAWTPVTTGSVPAVGATPARPLTRRELREAAARGESGPSAAPAGRPVGVAQPDAAEPAPPASPTGASPQGGAARAAAPSRAPWSPTSRRSRRDPSTADPSTADPVVAPAPSGPSEHAPGDDESQEARGPRPGWPRAVRSAAPQGAVPAAPSSAGTPTDPAGAGDARTGGPARGPWPGATPPAVTGDVTPAARPGAAHGRPSWAARGSVLPTTSEAGEGITRPMPPSGPSAAAPGPVAAGPLPSGAATPPAQPGRVPADARPQSSAAGQAAGRPSAAPVSAASATSPTAPGLGGRPGGWSPTLPPPGATVRPGASGGPDAPHAAAGRPAWLAGGPTPVPPGPTEPATGPDAGGRAPRGSVPPRPAPVAPQPPQPAGDPDAAAARADAWRRAWGLPPGAGTQDQDQQGSSGEEQR